MNGAESLVATLVDQGVEICFANPGTSEMHFLAALGNNPMKQATFLMAAMNCLGHLPRTRAIFWWDLVGFSPPGGGVTGFDYGLFDRNLQPRPAVESYRKYLQSRGAPAPPA